MTLLYSEDELKAQNVAELQKLGKTHDLIKGEDYNTKAELIKQLLKIDDGEDEEELEDELEEELEEDLDDEEDIDLDEELEDEEDEAAVIHAKKQKVDAEIDASIAREMENAKAGRKLTDKAPAKKTTAKKSTPAGDGEGALAAKQVATLLGIEAKTLRQFLRSPASTFEAVGSGGRYEFTEDDVPKLKEEFETWKSGHKSRGSARGPRGSKTEKPAVETLEEVDEIEELEEPDLEELDEEELELDDEELDEEED